MTPAGPPAYWVVLTFPDAEAAQAARVDGVIVRPLDSGAGSIDEDTCQVWRVEGDRAELAWPPDGFDGEPGFDAAPDPGP